MAAPAGAAICVLPLTIPDRWIEHQTAPWTPDDSFDVYAKEGNKQNSGAPFPKPDSYVPPGHTDATGYQPNRDKGMQLVLKHNNQDKVAPSMYNAWDLPGSVGGDDYKENLATCNQNLVKIGDTMTPENGNMTGPTQQGAEELLAQDQGAHWDTGCNCVKGSSYRVSPRIRIVPLYNPVVVRGGPADREEPASVTGGQLSGLLYRRDQWRWGVDGPDHANHRQDRPGRPPGHRRLRSSDHAGQITVDSLTY